MRAGVGKADFPEDWVNHHAEACRGDECHFRDDRATRAQRSALALFRDRICNPSYKVMSPNYEESSLWQTLWPPRRCAQKRRPSPVVMTRSVTTWNGGL